MRRTSELLSGSGSTAFKVALSVWLFCFSELDSDFERVSISVPALMAAMLAQYYVNYIAINKGAPLPLFVLAQIFMTGINVYVFVSSARLEPYASTPLAVTAVIHGFLALSTAYTAYEKPKQSGLVLCFDGAVAMLLLLLFTDRFRPLHGRDLCLYTCLFAMAFLLASLAAERSGRVDRGAVIQGSGGMGRMMLIVCFVLVAGAAGLITAFAAGGIASVSEACLAAIKWLWGVTLAFLAWLWKNIDAFLRWLARFVEPEEGAAPGAAEQFGAADVEIGEANLEAPAWFLAAVIGIAVLLLALLLFKLRRSRFKTAAIRPGREPTQLRRESGLGRAFKNWINGVMADIRYRINCIRYRRSPAGLLALCEKRASGELCRAAGESGESFLRRLDTITGGGGALSRLADMVELGFYSPRSETVPEELYRQIKKMRFR